MLGDLGSKFFNLSDITASEPYFMTLTVGIILCLLLVIARSIRVTRGQTRMLTLREAELRLQRRAVEAHAMLNIADREGRITYVNETLLRATGYTADELLGQTARIKLLAEPMVDISQMCSSLHKGEPWFGETALTRKDGSRIWTRSTVIPMLDRKGRIAKTISLRTDITASKLHQAETQTRQLLERLQDEVYVFATDSLQLLYINRRALDFQGWNEDEYRSNRFSNVIRDFDEPAFRRLTEPLLEGTAESITFEAEICGAAVEIGLQLENQPYDGSPRFIAVVRDITRRKQIEEAKAEFVATVSHELRAPLTSIRGALGLVASGSLGEVTPKSASMLNIAMRNTERLLLLINDILDLEKLDAGKMNFQMETVDLAELIEDTVAANYCYGQQFNVTFRTAGTQTALLAPANPDRLIQVITNLLSNAAKFSHPGGKVTVELIDAFDRASIIVTDQGFGIPQAEQARLFERFVQAEKGSGPRRNGSGLGLSIVKAIVERHGGTISLTSKVNVGTSVRIDLPKSQRLQNAA